MRPVFWVRFFFLTIVLIKIILACCFAAEERIGLLSRFDKAFYEEVKLWKCLDMYVLSYELNPTLTYRMEIGKEGVFFSSIDDCFSKREEAEEMVCDDSVCFELTSADILRVKALRINSSAGVYLKGGSGIEIEHFNLTSSSNLFCVLKDLSTLVAAFRVLFNPEGRRACKLKSTVAISGVINNDIETSFLCVRGVRWVRIAIRPLVAYQMLKEIYEPAPE